MRLNAIALTFLAVCSLLLNTAMADPNSYASDAVTESYQPTHQQPEHLIKTLEPLFAKSARFSTDGTRVLIHTDAHTMAKIAELLPTLDHAVRQFEIEFSNQPTHSATKTYSTASRSLQQQTFIVTDNEPLTLLKQTQIQTVAGAGLLWREVTQIPTQQEFIQLHVQSSENYVQLSYKLQSMTNGQLTAVTHTVNAKLGDWIALNGKSTAATNQHTVSSGSRGTMENVYIKITEKEQ